MEAEVVYYCEDHDNVDFAILSECFGKPEDVAKDFLSELGESVVVEENSNRQRFFYLLLTIFTFIVLGVAIHISYIQHTLLDTQYIESISDEKDLSAYITGFTYAIEDNLTAKKIDNIPDSK